MQRIDDARTPAFQRRIDELTGQAHLLDGETWRQLHAGTTIFKYLEHKLRLGLNTWKTKKGEGDGRRTWMYNQGSVQWGIMWCSGRMENQQTSTRGADQGDEQWWPIIFLYPHGGLVGRTVATNCPALAWGGGRPWMADISRIFLLPHCMPHPEYPIELVVPARPIPTTKKDDTDDDDTRSVRSYASTAPTLAPSSTGTSVSGLSSAQSATTTASTGHSWEQLSVADVDWPSTHEDDSSDSTAPENDSASATSSRRNRWTRRHRE